MNSEESILRYSRDQVIEMVLENRNVVIGRLLHGGLTDYLKERHQLENVSAIKIEFAKRSLMELRSTSVDLVHYAPLIMHVQRTGMEVIGSHDTLYHQEIDRVMKNHFL
jgi:hypothetical protein